MKACAVKKRTKIAVTAFLLLGSWLAFGPIGLACAEEKISLSSAVKDRLIALKPLAGPRLDRTAFREKPVLVSFFASW